MVSEPKRSYAVQDLDPTEAYKLASGLTVPRPIGWIGTVSAEGIRNLAPYSFFNMVARYPPTFVVAPLLDARKDTLNNVKATGVFTVNIVTEETVVAMNASAASLPAEVDEFDACGLTAVKADTSDAPLVAEAVANFECTVKHMIPLGAEPEDNRASGMLIIGEAQNIHVAERVIDDAFHIDQRELHAIGRLAGGYYTKVSDGLFTIERPS